MKNQQGTRIINVGDGYYTRVVSGDGRYYKSQVWRGGRLQWESYEGTKEAALYAARSVALQLPRGLAITDGARAALFLRSDGQVV